MSDEASDVVPDVAVPKSPSKWKHTSQNRHRFQPSRGSSASLEERSFILEQLKETFPSLDESQLKHLLNRMEFRMIDPGKLVIAAGEPTASCFYVVLAGKVNVDGDDSVKVFGKDLIESAEFRKTGGGKLVSSLVESSYSVIVDQRSGCRLAVLTAVAYREVLKEEEASQRSENQDDKDEQEEQVQVQEENGGQVNGEPKQESDEESLEDDGHMPEPMPLDDVNEADETENTEASATDGVKEVQTVPDEAGRKVQGATVKRMYIPPKNVTQERIEDEELAKFVRPEYDKPKAVQKEIKMAMSDNPLLSSLSKETVNHVTAAMKKSKVKAGERLIENSGEENRYYCVVSEGECDFAIKGFGDKDRFIAGKGFTFGEEALTCPTSSGTPLKHGIVATTDCEFYKVEHTTYRKLVAKDTHEERAAKIKALEQVSFVEVMAHDHLHVSFLESLTLDNREKLLDIMTLQEFERGDVIVSKEKSKDTFLIVKFGQVECRDMSSELHSEMSDITLDVGKHFGDQVLCNDVKYPRLAEIVGKSKSGSVYTVSKEKLKAVIGTPLDLIPVDARSLGSIEALKRKPTQDLPRDHLVKLSHRFKNKTYAAGTVIVEADQETDACIYIVRKGNASSTKGRIKKGLLPGNYFGEDLFQQCLKANVPTGVSKVKLEAQTTCVLGVLTFKAYFDAIRHADDFSSLSVSRHTKKPSKKPPKKKLTNWPQCNIKLEELEKLKCLGQGNFGQVWLAREKSGEQAAKPFVLKIQSKQYLSSINQVKVAIEEKQALQLLHHPFIVDLLNAYQDNGFVYMLLEYLPGGELYSVLSPPEGPAVLPEPLAKFYALCIAEALSYMHGRNIIFRDLKPENVLIDAQGYPKLIDFGFAKCIDGPTYTMCGTPGYIAPEVLLNTGHGKSYDHWQLGVLIYDMLSYDSPFFDPYDDEEELQRRVVEDPLPGIIGEVSAEAWDLISGLLVKDPKKRLGSLKRRDRDILRHKWFEGTSLSELREKRIEAPWAPEIPEDPFDTSLYENFSEIEDMTTGEHEELEPGQAKLFVNFTD